MPKENQNRAVPAGHGHLCVRCSWGQSMTGYRESDRLVICTYSNLNLVVPFQILNCTSFEDRCRPSWSRMQRLAIDLRRMRVTTPAVGFGAAREARPVVQPKENPEDSEDEAAFLRWLTQNLTGNQAADQAGRGYIW
jgi:hypothetical protein